jgi:Flp pilus assembly protein TadD
MQEASEHLKAGIQAFQTGDIARAISELEEATRLDGSNAQAFMYLGAAYGNIGKYNLAVGAFKVAEQISPQDPKIHFNIAQAYEAAGNPGEAEYEYEKALAIDSSYQRARQALNALRARMGG